MDEPDAVLVGNFGACHHHFLPVDEHIALRGKVSAGQHIHQCGFSGAVLAQQTQNRTGLDGDADIVYCAGGAEIHHDVFHFHKHRAVSSLF